MGFQSSNEYIEYKKISQAELQKNIENLFGKRNNIILSEDSITNFDKKMNMSLKNNDLKNYNFIGGGRNITSRTQKYKDYNLGEFLKQKMNQYGGNIDLFNQDLDTKTSENYNELSNFSEFDRIRDYMVSQMKDGQNGGQMNFDSSEKNKFNILTPSPVTPNNKPFNLLNIMKGGAYSNNNSDSNSVVFSSEDTGQFDFKTSESTFTLDSLDNSSINFSPINNYSETSSINVDNLDSELNIYPFYSSESSEDYSFQHPYVKDRFN